MYKSSSSRKFYRDDVCSKISFLSVIVIINELIINEFLILMINGFFEIFCMLTVVLYLLLLSSFRNTINFLSFSSLFPSLLCRCCEKWNIICSRHRGEEIEAREFARAKVNFLREPSAVASRRGGNNFWLVQCRAFLFSMYSITRRLSS